MNNETKDYENQAEELQNLLNEVEGASEKPSPEDNGDKEVDDTYGREVDILNLPPRKEVHSENKGRIRFKFSSALLRLLFVIVIIILIIAGSYIYFGEEFIEIFNTL